MSKNSTSHFAIASSLPSPQEAFDDVLESFERFCLLSGIEVLEKMLEEDAEALCGKPYSRSKNRKGHRWGETEGPIGFHGGKAKIKRPRVRGKDQKEIPLPSWTAAQEEDWLGHKRRGASAASDRETKNSDEPDADQCFDAQVRPRRAPA